MFEPTAIPFNPVIPFHGDKVDVEKIPRPQAAKAE
jgi:hypothetical protein